MHSWWIAYMSLPWAGALALALWPRRWDAAAGLVAIAFALATVLAGSGLHAQWPAPGTAVLMGSWPLAPGLGFELLWFRDGLSSLFGFLTCWIALVVTVFAWRYMPHAIEEKGGYRRASTFYALLSAFTGAMLGLIASANLLQFYAFWELTSLASFLLIGFFYRQDGAREGAVRSLGLTTVGSLAMLVGFLCLHAASGHWSLLTLLDDPPPPGGLVAAAAGLVAVGALSKAAQFPFSNWLPGAMAAPTPVSAFLHSAALVATGIYLLARFFPLLGGQHTWSVLLIGSGLIGVLVSGVLALRQSTVKGLLAYSTISQYAFICLAFGTGTLEGAEAGLYAFFVHAILKAGLFLVAGSVTHLTGESHFKALGGLRHSHPTLALMAVVLALSLGGVPALGGFYYKEELLYAAYAHEAWLLLATMLVGGMLTFLYMMRFLNGIFFGPPSEQPLKPMPASMALAVGTLAVGALATAVFPDWMNRTLLDAAISAVVRQPVHFQVHLQFGELFVLSVGVLALGFALWWLYQRGQIDTHWAGRLPRAIDLGGASVVALYGALSRRLLAIHSGNLRRYLRLELAAGLGLFALCWMAGDWRDWSHWGSFDLALTLMLAVALVAAAATVFVTSHVTAIIALTIAGYALAAVFALMHAPDVALAQVLVETLSTVAIVVALRQSQLVHPERTRIFTSGKRDRLRWAIALACGTGVGWATFWAGRRIPPDSVGERYASEGEALTGMQDLVTAILTDFRALDTAIEILVFASAAFAVMALFRRREDPDAS